MGDDIIRIEDIPAQYMNVFLDKMEDESLRKRMEYNRKDFEAKRSLHLLQELMIKRGN